MIDDILEQIVDRALLYCSKTENQEKVIGPLEKFIAIRFAWLIRCFELMTSLVIAQTLVLAYVVMRLHRLNSS